jgi:hypothetical protein
MRNLILKKCLNTLVLSRFRIAVLFDGYLIRLIKELKKDLMRAKLT